MSITIKPVRFAENGFMTCPFAIGISPERSEHCGAMSLEGCEGAEGLDPAVKYRSCLQNWVIDTGSEVILVDTDVPEDFPFGEPTEDATIYVGKRKSSRTSRRLPTLATSRSRSRRYSSPTSTPTTRAHCARRRGSLRAAASRRECRIRLCSAYGHAESDSFS